MHIHANASYLPFCVNPCFWIIEPYIVAFPNQNNAKGPPAREKIRILQDTIMAQPANWLVIIWTGPVRPQIIT